MEMDNNKEKLVPGVNPEGGRGGSITKNVGADAADAAGAVEAADACPSKEMIRQVRAMRHGEEVQHRLETARVAVAGLGGLGSNIAISLLRMGVGHLHLIDMDEVDLSNLNRQQYGIRHLGRLKTEALREELLEIDPYADIRTDNVRVDEENIGTLFEDDEIICEAFDNPQSKAMLVNYILEKYPDKYIVAASGMAGYGKSNAIRTRQLSPRFILCGDGVTEGHKGNGLMAPRVALAAAHEANAIIELILDGAVLNEALNER